MIIGRRPGFIENISGETHDRPLAQQVMPQHRPDAFQEASPATLPPSPATPLMPMLR